MDLNKLLAEIPTDFVNKANELTIQLRNSLKGKSFNGEAGAGLVKVTVIYPGKVKAVLINAEFTPENKALIEDLIPAAIDRALESLYNEETEVARDLQEKLTKLLSQSKEASSSIEDEFN